MLFELASRFAITLLLLSGLYLLITKKRRASKILGVLILCLFALSLNGGVTGFSILPSKNLCANCNVILIMPEVLRKDYVGLYSGVNYTPNIDAFFSNAWKFTEFYDVAPWTGPSQASLFTGLLPNKHGLGERDGYINASLQTLAGFLRDKDYYTIYLNAGGYIGGDEYGFSNGFNYTHEIYKMYFSPEKIVTTAAKAALSGKKFFLAISGSDIHELYNKGPLSKAMNYSGLLSDDEVNSNYFERMHAAFGANQLLNGPLYVSKNGSIMNMTDYDLKYYRLMYADNVYMMDAALKPLFDFLESSGLVNNTMIILLSDHGEELYEHWIGHTQFYQPVINTPMLIKFPGSTFKTIDDLTSNVDLFPTLSAMLGYDSPKRTDGINVLKEKRDYAYGYNTISPQVYMVTDGKQKLIMQDLNGVGNVEMYDLTLDPGERDNLAKTQNFYDTKLFSKLKNVFVK